MHAKQWQERYVCMPFGRDMWLYHSFSSEALHDLWWYGRLRERSPKDFGIPVGNRSHVDLNARGYVEC